jgi:pimeloyl-ACP methyl ester carboxylesterase
MRRLRIEGDGVILSAWASISPEPSRRPTSATERSPGAASGPALILLHGYAESAASWRETCARLARRRVIALDLRGHGHSGRPADGAYTLEATARDVAAACTRLALDAYVLAGHSTGGMTALAHASTRPPGLVGLALLDVDPFRFKDGLERLLPFRGRRTPGTRADFVRDWLAAHPGGDARRAWRDLSPLQRRTRAGRWTWRLDPRLRPREPVFPARPRTRAQVDALLGRVTVPTLLLRGARSTAVSRADLEASAQRIAAEVLLREIAGAGHALPAEASDRVAAELERFLGLISRRSRGSVARPSSEAARRRASSRYRGT